MIIRNTTEEAVVAAARATHVRARFSFRPYWSNGNGRVDANGEKLGVASVTIRPGEGCTQRARSRSGRRVHAVYWHGHRDFFRALFVRTPSAVIISRVARYEGSADFEASFAATGSQNVGSQMNPLRLDRACDCGRASAAVTA